MKTTLKHISLFNVFKNKNNPSAPTGNAIRLEVEDDHNFSLVAYRQPQKGMKFDEVARVKLTESDINELGYNMLPVVSEAIRKYRWWRPDQPQQQGRFQMETPKDLVFARPYLRLEGGMLLRIIMGFDKSSNSQTPDRFTKIQFYRLPENPTEFLATRRQLDKEQVLWSNEGLIAELDLELFPKTASGGSQVQSADKMFIDQLMRVCQNVADDRSNILQTHRKYFKESGGAGNSEPSNIVTPQQVMSNPVTNVSINGNISDEEFPF